MMPAWYNRMNRRERTLSIIVAGALFVILNLIIWSTLLGAIKSTHAQLAERKGVRKTQTIFLKERDLWKKREAWLKAHQPVLQSAGEASTLLDRVKQIAAKYKILLVNPAIGTGTAASDHQSVYASVETKSPWPPLVHFLYDIQQPDAFIVFEDMSLAIDGTDQTMMHGRFKIARWYAPQRR